MTHRTRAVCTLLALFCVVTLFNLGKAVHIDDPTYLLIAEKLVSDPWHPLSGELILSGAPIQVFSTNQPPLLFYLYAASLKLFGPSELILHAIMALFGGAAIFLFYRLALRFCAGVALPLTAAFSLGAAFLPAQNLMTDVPLLALWLAFFWVLSEKLLSRERASTAWILAAGATAAGACLMKYTSLVLLPLLLLPVLLRRDRRAFAALAIPVAVLLAWSAWNYAELGRVHLTSRASDPAAFSGVVGRMRDWLLCLGAAGPLALGAVPWALQRRRPAGIAFVATAFAMLLFEMAMPEKVAHPILGRLFFANGALGLALAALALGDESLEREQRWLLLGWIGAAGGFIVCFAPFMAMRHVLLAVPPVMLGLGRLLQFDARGRWRSAALAACCAIGLGLGLSDWLYADVYRQQAALLRERFGDDARLWYLGNWGWRWYAEAQGMAPYLPGRSRLEAGDLVIIPSLPAGPKWVAARDARRVVRLDAEIIPASAGTRLRTMQPLPLRGYYKFRFPGLPWVVSDEPLERFEILEVQSP